MIGSYEIRVCAENEIITLPNGKCIAGLSCILSDSSEYVGGDMIFNGYTTVIKNIHIEPIGDGVLFAVTSEEFNMSFTLKTGIILKYESNYITFNTEHKGMWTIYKKV